MAVDLYNIFPLDPGRIQWTSKIKPTWNTTSFFAAGQGRKALTYQKYPTYTFEINFPFLSRAEVDILLAFHAHCRGSWNPFFYMDYEKHNVTEYQLKDNETYYIKADGLPLVIPYQYGSYYYTEPCYMAENIHVYRDGVEDLADWEVTPDPDTGQLVLWLTDVTLAQDLETVEITATYDYYYRVTFQDSITINEKFKDVYSVSLALKTVEQLITDTGDNDKWHSYDVYNVHITQSAHQTITVRKYRNGTFTSYTSSFTVIGSWTIEVLIDADGGYVPGTLYVDGVACPSGTTLTVDHDIDIVADAAELGSVMYANGQKGNQFSSNNVWYFYSDSNFTTHISKNSLSGRLKLCYTDEQLSGRYDGSYMFGANATHVNEACKYVREIEQNVDTSHMTTFRFAFAGCTVLKSVDLSSWDVGNLTTTYGMFSDCTSLLDVGDISDWNTVSLQSTDSMFANCSALVSIDLSNWKTNSLTSLLQMFDYCSSLQVVDISKWDTTNITTTSSMFGRCTALRYVIMDDDEIKFSGNVALPDANNSVKYLVPASMVSSYQAHANWGSRASRIDSIDNYNITRNNGHITVEAI